MHPQVLNLLAEEGFDVVEVVARRRRSPEDHYAMIRRLKARPESLRLHHCVTNFLISVADARSRGSYHRAHAYLKEARYFRLQSQAQTDQFYLTRTTL